MSLHKTGQADVLAKYNLIRRGIGDIGLVVYEGQSAEEVLTVAAKIEEMIEGIDRYTARSVAREVLKIVRCNEPDKVNDL